MFLLGLLLSCARPKPDLGDLTACAAMLGQTAEEAGIAEKALDGDWAEVTGTLFGEKASAEIRFGRADGSSPGKIDRICVTCKGVSLEKALEELTERYGEPTESGTVPYVPVNHGAVYWHIFETDAFAVRLSKASEDRHIEIRFAPSADDLRL